MLLRMRKNKQQTLVRGKRVVLDKTLNLVVPKTLHNSTQDLYETGAPSKGIERITSLLITFGNNFHKPVSDPI